MAIKKVPQRASKLAPTQRESPTALDKRACATCNAERKIPEFRFVAASLLDPTLYFCNIDCYKPWQAKQAKAMPPKL